MTTPARVGIDVTSALTQGGGIGRYTRDLIRAVVKAEENKEFLLYSAKKPRRLPLNDPLPEAANVSYREFPLSERWLYRLWYRLNLPFPVQWLTGHLDLLHSPDFVLPPVRDNIPTLLTVHDLSFVHYPETFTPSLVTYLEKAVPSSVARATHILADSQATKDDLASIWRVSTDKISVLYSGVNNRFRPVVERAALDQIREKYQLGLQPYILSVGTLQPRKNYGLLIRAFRLVAEQTSCNLVIAGGKGWLLEQTLAEVKKQNLTQRVKIVGFVDDGDLPVLYSGAILFTFPSLYEGFGFPLLEAMACGVPVISSNASSLPEVAGDAARLIDPTDEYAWSGSMLELLQDDGARTSLVAAGFLQVRRFSWNRAASQLVDIYDHLLDLDS